MNMTLKIGPRAEAVSVTANCGDTVESIYRRYQKDMTYRAVLCKINNRYRSLTYVLSEVDEGATIELLDMRNQGANLVYQSSLALVCLTAIHKCIPNAQVVIENSLSQGLYLAVRDRDGFTEEQAEEIASTMRRYVEADLPVQRKRFSREEGEEIMRRQKRNSYLKLLSHRQDLDSLTFYSIDGYYDYFFTEMVPSAGYVDQFTFSKYKQGALLRFPLSKDPSTMPPMKEQKKLYQAFGEQRHWDILMKTECVADLNEIIRSDEYRQLFLISEALHEKKIVEIAKRIKEEKKRVVLIAGPSSSGKTTFAKRLCVQLSVNEMDPLYMGTDDYFVERVDTPLDENGEPDYEGLDAMDIELFNQNMNDLLAGKEVDLPTFDFLTGTKIFGKRITKIKANQTIVIEGIHGLNEKMTEQIPKEEKFKIYISPLTQLNIDEHTRIPTTDERMLRRMVRDFQFRGRPAQQTLRDWPKVRAGEDKNIFPYSDESDVFFNSYHDYEISVLKKYAEPLLSAIKPEEPEYADAQRMLYLLKPFALIEDDTAIANNSIIREFIGGSIFVE